MDDVNTGSINITIDNTVPWKELANSPFGTTWGDWRTTTSVTSNTVVTGTVQNINFTATGMRISSTNMNTPVFDFSALWGKDGRAGLKTKTQGEILIAAVEKQAAAAGIDPNLVRGNLTVLYAGTPIANI